MQTKHNQIVARIEQLGEGKAFSAKDFLDIASRGISTCHSRKPSSERKNPPCSARPLRHAEDQSRARREVEPGH